MSKSKYRIALEIIRVTVLCLSLVLLAISAMTGMLMNYLLVFLMVSAAAMIVTLIVCVVRKQVCLKVTDVESVRTFVMVGILKNMTWVVIGVCIYVALVPIQFSSGDFTNVMVTLWGCVVLLCLLDWVPRKRIGRSLNITLCVFLIFLVFQLVVSYIPPRSADSIELSPFFKDNLYVIQGGNSALMNHHYFAGSQKYALDLIVPGDGKLPMEQETDLEQYKTFGRELYSPVQGVVVAAKNNLPDQKIGETDQKNLAGNYVVIRIEADVFLLMAHLKNNSVLVSEGDSVKVGQWIARIGNSGNTTQPHLHVHAMTKADFTNPNSKPLPFSVKVEDGSSIFFKRNDVVHRRLN